MTPSPGPDRRPTDAAEIRREAIVEAMESARRGDSERLSSFISATYAELRRYAARLMADESSAHTFEPTDLVHEAFDKAVDRAIPVSNNPAANFMMITRLMRRILIDHARAKHAQKRGGKGRKLQLTDDLSAPDTAPDDLLTLDPHIKRLGETHPDLHEVFMLHFFGGLTHAEIAEAVLRVSERTVIRRWEKARTLLQERLGDEHPTAS